MKLIILGSGTSTGVPEVGCLCNACRSTDERDRRLRASALLITDEGKRILIDCGPDFRQQALRYGIDHLDGIIITHEHYDHIAGLDDLRTICWRESLPIYAQARVLDAIRHRLHYVFGAHPYPGSPRLELFEIQPDRPFELCGLEITPFEVMHGRLPILGFRMGSLAYITDLKSLPEASRPYISGLDLLVVNALRQKKSHPSHQSIDDVLELLEGLEHRPRLSLLTHLSHHAPVHRLMEATLPQDVRPAYDGLSIELSHAPQTFRLESYRPTTLRLECRDCGYIAYSEAYELQHRLFDSILDCKRRAEETESYLLLCEHNPVFTFGKHADRANMLMDEDFLRSHGYEWYSIERGGDVTYHGPGQITGYPILDLEAFGLGLRAYIELLEEAIIELLALYDIRGERRSDATGVWLDATEPCSARKICAIGVRSSRYVTMHGFALNVNNDLAPFRLINPCGFVDGQVSSIAQEKGEEVDITVVKHQLSAIIVRRLRERLEAFK